MTRMIRRVFLMMVVLCVCAISIAQADKKFKLTGKDWSQAFVDAVPIGRIKIDKKQIPSDITRSPPEISSADQDAFFGCVVKTADGSVWCWVDGWRGQLGTGAVMTNSDKPVAVIEEVSGLPLIGAIQVDVSTSTACALKKDGTVWCWGWTGEGLLPFRDHQFQNNIAPRAVQVMESQHPQSPLKGIKRITVSLQLVCAIREVDGRVYCWGYNPYGGKGWGDRFPPEEHLEVLPHPEIRDIVSIDSEIHVCAVRNDGRVWCWGWNSNGQVGVGLIERIREPTEVKDAQGLPLDGIVTTNVTTTESCLLDNKGRVLCWGDCGGFIGQLPGGCRKTPTALLDPNQQPIVDAIYMRTGKNHVCMVRSDFTLWCKGSNDAGQLGDGTRMRQNEPKPVTFGVLQEPMNALYVAPGYYHTCYVTAGGKFACWGDDQMGALGDGNGFMNSPIPVLVDF